MDQLHGSGCIFAALAMLAFAGTPPAVAAQVNGTTRLVPNEQSNPFGRVVRRQACPPGQAPLIVSINWFRAGNTQSCDSTCDLYLWLYIAAGSLRGSRIPSSNTYYPNRCQTCQVYPGGSAFTPARYNLGCRSTSSGRTSFGLQLYDYDQTSFDDSIWSRTFSQVPLGRASATSTLYSVDTEWIATPTPPPTPPPTTRPPNRPRTRSPTRAPTATPCTARTMTFSRGQVTPSTCVAPGSCSYDCTASYTYTLRDSCDVTLRPARVNGCICDTGYGAKDPTTGEVSVRFSFGSDASDASFMDTMGSNSVRVTVDHSSGITCQSTYSSATSSSGSGGGGDDAGLSAGVIAGIAAAISLLCCCGIGAYIYQKRKTDANLPAISSTAPGVGMIENPMHTGNVAEVDNQAYMAGESSDEYAYENE